MTGLSGGAGELPPCAPTEPYVTLSRHTALVAEPSILHRPGANARTARDSCGEFAATTRMPAPGFAALACACA